MTTFTQGTFPLHVAGWATIPLEQANTLLTAWRHSLGPVRRPFGSQAWLLDVGGTPAAVAVSCSIVSPTVHSFRRNQVVELARLCSAPDARWATRVALRLWREVAATRWPYWHVAAAVSYSQNARHGGDIYRFDGWTKVSTKCGNETSATATWSKVRDRHHPARGPKTLWLWRFTETDDTAE
ncbi:hypothetical protein [Actinomadura violacea]|uniref:Uncharacterized protein n=1 Tax=Actinomadura violacea TaxID=2819934 RepID=A0ABS3RYV3_9ACTN|nr:hypothetical protein [Actinomadura violacea]MBO2461185.1 hypothetical protein [Actinomadura violacea]